MPWSCCISLTLYHSFWLSLTFSSVLWSCYMSHTVSYGCWLSLTVSMIPFTCYMSLTVSDCCKLSLTDSIELLHFSNFSSTSMELLHVSQCLLLLLAFSHRLPSPMGSLHFFHCLLCLQAVSHCVSPCHGVPTCLSQSPMVAGYLSQSLQSH